ncbi:ribonuclease E inhibitor RraB [Sandarakinorhabdus sp.]|uniref:ribonuclease E inhibitor RraB n=1 Tax=Sandarakinorhabdus sp. TaxID=1916663 RepID=UPI00286DA485|nr:ribonuclease E inhibitor RraB [Sandarakinorhabdus sp.]
MIDPARLADEIESNEEVLMALAANGDIAELPRTIDVHFKGPQDAIEQLAEDAQSLNFRFFEFGDFEDGDWAADLQVDGPVTRQALKALITRALEIEISHGVEFDGWGCLAENGSPE